MHEHVGTHVHMHTCIFACNYSVVLRGFLGRIVELVASLYSTENPQNREFMKFARILRGVRTLCISRIPRILRLASSHGLL